MGKKKGIRGEEEFEFTEWDFTTVEGSRDITLGQAFEAITKETGLDVESLYYGNLEIFDNDVRGLNKVYQNHPKAQEERYQKQLEAHKTVTARGLIELINEKIGNQKE